MSREKYPKLEFNRLKMYFGDDYVIDLPDLRGSITVHQPTIGDLAEIGEDRFFSTLSVFINNTTTMRATLWSAGIDWNEISDFDLFCITYRTIDPEVSKLIFGDIDWNKFEVCTYENGDVTEIRLLNKEDDLEINQDVYQHIHQYLQSVFQMYPEDELTDDKMLKKWWVDKDIREAKRKSESKDEIKKSSLQAMISAYINHPGTSYKLKELKEVGVCEFYDSIARLRIYENSTATLKGMFSGFVDGSKIKPEDYDFMKPIV